MKSTCKRNKQVKELSIHKIIQWSNSFTNLKQFLFSVGLGFGSVLAFTTNSYQFSKVAKEIQQ